MKVRKEQFLLPKGKTINTSSKWIQPMKTGEITKSVNCTCFPTQSTSVEPIPSALIAKIKPDMLLSSGDIIVSGQPGGQLFWQQQNGILRQALLTEKDVKSEEKAMEVEGSGSQTQVNSPQVLTITPVQAAQVIKMSDYKVIMASEPVPMAWQEGGKKNNTFSVSKNNTLSMSTLPPIKPKVDSTASLQPVTFAAISNVNMLAPNQYPTIMIKDIKSTNLVLSNPLMPQNPTPKKAISKSVPKLAKVRKKPITAKKIMLKPPSSLLSQIALDRTNQNRIVELKEKSNTKQAVSESSGNKTITDDSPNDHLVQNHTKVVIPTSNELPTSASKMFITTHNTLSFNPSLSLKPTENSLTLTNIQKTDFVACLTTKTTESHLNFEPSSVNVVGHSMEDGEVIMTSNGQSVDAVLMDSNTPVICADGQTLLDASMVVEPNCTTDNSGSNPDLIRSDEFNTDHVETILPSDIEHHDEHHTENLLSQLQLTTRVLPNISCSQVSSVLNALAPVDKTCPSETNTFTSAKNDKEPVKCEPTEFVKIESLQPNAIKALKAKVPEPKYRLCELNKHVCYRCVSCAFLSVQRESVEQHWDREHRGGRSELLDRQLTRRQIRCLGCANVVYSKYALQIHLLCDHNVITTEVHELIATTLAANKGLRDVKRPPNLKPPSSAKTKDVVQEAELNKEVTVGVSPSAVFQPDVPSDAADVAPTADFAPSEPHKVDDQKLNEPQIPPTPSFSLFSDIQLPNDKEETVPPEEAPVGEDSKQLIKSKKCARRLRRAERSKLKAEFETMYNFRCMVERCGVRFTTAANLSYHLRCHQVDSEGFHCPECETVTTAWPTLASHLWRCHNTDIDLYCCKLCGYKCNSYSKMVNNHIKIHGDERPFLCDICGKGFKTTKQLRNHKAVHRARGRLLGEGGGCYTCKVCGRGFADARILRHHTENVHNKLRPYMCTFCSHTASCKSSLRMHIRQHTGEKPFSCDECKYVTADHNSLRRHKMRHSGRRPYQCPHCSYSCIQATTYKAHLKNKHPGMDEGLMFSCGSCPFRTVKKDNYLAHKAEHELGGDPRLRRRKHHTTADEQSLALCKTITQVLPDDETVVLLEDSNDLPSVQGAIEFIVPEAD